ncbi:MAG: hypothetical protein OHK0015_28110 [Chloroflexi bacterium OHK40]
MIGCVRFDPPDEDSLRALRISLEQLSPRVVLRPDPPQLALLADLGRGQLADARHYAATLQGCAVSHRLNATIAVTPTPTLAILAARVAVPDVPLVVGPAGVRALLERCRVSWLEPFTPLAPLLHGLGLRSLGAVAALPAAAISARFGATALQGWRLLQGEELPLVPLPTQPRLGLRQVFGSLVADRTVLAAVLRRMTARLAAALQRRGVQARALALHLHTDSGIASAGRVLASPAAEAATLTPIAAGLLAASGLQDGVERVDLLVGELVPLRGEQLSLFVTASAVRAERETALADLAARLGPQQILRPAVNVSGLALAEERGRLSGWGAA